MSSGYSFDKKVQVGKWEVGIDSKKQYGYFEHDDYGEGGGLWFANNSLYDFDGCSILPANVKSAIEQCGFVVEDSFTGEEN